MTDISLLRKAGLSDSQILRVLELEQAERRAARREQNRINQQNHRSRQQVSADGADNADGHIDTSLREIKKKESKKVSISADWKPTDADREYARSKGWPDARIDAEAERFHNHYLANGEARKSWPASWRKWVTSPYQNSNAGNGGQTHGRRHGSVLDALDRIGERLKAEGASDDYVPGSSGPRPLELDQEMRPINPRLVSSR